MINHRFLKITVIIVFLISVFFQLHSISTPLLDQYGFRQTQTAITSFWFIKEGFAFDYLTPVLGWPWSIPMEFPIYQYIVFLFSEIFRISNLDITGRVVSLVFFYLCIYPLYKILKLFKLDSQTILLTFITLFSMPIFIFWSRTFMIESTALFFTLMFILYILRYDTEINKKILIPIILFGLLAILTKITTFLVGLFFLFFYIIFFKRISNIINIKNIIVLIATLFVIAIGVLWNEHANNIKEISSLTQFLTSDNLKNWNFGTLNQRLDVENYLLIGQHIKNNNSFVIFILLLVPFFLLKKEFKYKKILIISILTFFISAFTLFNLYKVHSYYWYGNSLFIVIAISIILNSLLLSIKNKILKYIVLFIFISLNLYQYIIYYYPSQISDFSKDRIIVIGNIIKEVTPENSILITSGLDWDSSLPYYSERKAIMLRDNKYLLDEKNKYIYQKSIEQTEVGSIVLCNNKNDIEGLSKLLDMNKFDEFLYADCKVYVKNKDLIDIKEKLNNIDLTFEERDFFFKNEKIKNYEISLEKLYLVNGNKENINTFKSLNSDMYFIFDIPTECFSSKEIGLEVNISKESSSYSQLFYRGDNNDFNERDSIKKGFTEGNSIMKFLINNNNNNLRKLRFDPSVKNEIIKIDSIKVYCENN